MLWGSKRKEKYFFTDTHKKIFYNLLKLLLIDFFKTGKKLAYSPLEKVLFLNSSRGTLYKFKHLKITRKDTFFSLGISVFEYNINTEICKHIVII